MRPIVRLAAMSVAALLTLSFSSCITLALTGAAVGTAVGVTGAVASATVIPIKIAGKGLEHLSEKHVRLLYDQSLAWQPLFVSYQAMPEVVTINDTCIYILDSNLQRQAWQNFGFDVDDIDHLDLKVGSSVDEWRTVSADGYMRSLHLNYNVDTLKVFFKVEEVLNEK